MAEASIGLRVDLTGFRRGVTSAARLASKSLGAGSSAMRGIHGTLARARFTIQRGFLDPLKRVGGTLLTLKGAAAAFVAALALGRIASTVRDLVEASRAAADARALLSNAVQAAGAQFDVAAFQEFARDVSSTLGVAVGDINRAAADFLGRGFGEDQVRELTVLAANAAKATGREIKDVSKTIADALNGEVDALKELGIQIPKTGNAYQDQIAAAEELAKRYGDVGLALVNPSEKLSATWARIRAIVGDKLAPAFDWVIQKVNELLTSWEEGGMNRELQMTMDVLAGIGGAVAHVVDIAGAAYTAIKEYLKAFWLSIKALWDGVVQLVKNGIPALGNFIVSWVLEMVDDIIRNLPGGGLIADRLGLGDIAKEYASASTDAWSRMTEGMQASTDAANQQTEIANAAGRRLWDGITSGQVEGGASSRMRAWLERQSAAGAEELARRQESVTDRQRLTGEDLMSSVARENERRRQEEEWRKQQEKLAAKIARPPQDGDRVDVSVMLSNTSPDRWRKAQTR